MRIETALDGFPGETWEERTAREILVTLAARMATPPNEEEARHCYRLARALAAERENPTPVPKEWLQPPAEEEDTEL